MENLLSIFSGGLPDLLMYRLSCREFVSGSTCKNHRVDDPALQKSQKRDK